MTGIALELPEHIIEEIARRAAEIIAANTPNTPYMTVGEAADYARCKPQRIYDLISARRIPRHKDGARVLVRRDDLDAYLTRAA